jgi:hypothetical protein
LRRHLSLLPFVLLAACAAVPPAPLTPETPAQAVQRRTEAPKPAYNLTGYPPAVRDGYIDGCETAKGSSYGRKDAQRIGADAQYSMGWNDGFAICSKR